MGTLWILEKSNHDSTRITDILIGDFAVRAVASLKSLVAISRLGGANLPDAVIVDCRFGEWSIDQINIEIKDVLPDCSLFLVCSDGTGSDSLPSGLHKLNLTDDTLQFVTELKIKIRHQAKARTGALIKYRDMVLDISNLSLRLKGSLEDISLPQKELQLLKLLIANCGQVIDRSEISAAVWSGIKVSPRTIDSHISRLRTKLTGSQISIRSVYGGGYLLR